MVLTLLLLLLVTPGCFLAPGRSAAPAPRSVAGAEPLLARATEARGLAFLAPAPVLALPRGQVHAVLERELDRVAPPSEVARQADLMAAIGLLPPRTPLREIVLTLQSAAVVGFFTPVDRVLYVVGEPDQDIASDPGLASIVVHEAVHALQAQHSQIPDVTLGLEDHDDLAFALSALLEGDATWSMLRDEALQTGQPQLRADDVAIDVDVLRSEFEDAEVPRWLREVFLTPYRVGHVWVEQVADAGGLAALDTAYRAPPLSSRDLLHPERGPTLRPLPLLRLPGELDPSAAPQGAGCAPVATNTYGEIGLRTWAIEAGAPHEAARQAAAGWDGDRAQLRRCDGGEQAYWLVQFETPRDADEFADVARGRWRGAIQASGSRVLLSRELDPADAERVLRRATLARYDDLDAYLAARPEVLRRGRALRDARALDTEASAP